MLTTNQIKSTEDAGAEHAHTYFESLIDENGDHRDPTLADLEEVGEWSESALRGSDPVTLMRYCGIEGVPWESVRDEFCEAWERGAYSVVKRISEELLRSAPEFCV